jgi:chemotaxis protein histidine kinase CheA
MTQPLGIDDFFVLEASEYLDRLAVLAGGSTAPNADELVRFTRALRGSALMANQQPIARASSGLEHLVRGFRDGKRTWDHDLTSLTREAVDMLRTLVERVRSWTPDDTARAERLALQLEAAAGSGGRTSGSSAIINDSGVRAFLARESAALGSVLDQGARSLLGGSASAETLQAIQRRMQPLRGLAALNDYPPLPDLLDGIERALVGVSRLEIGPIDGGARLESAARALSRAARDIAEHGHPQADAAEFRSFASLVLASESAEQPVVSIESLYFDGQEGIVERGTPPRTGPATGFGAAAVVSRGEHLTQQADELASAASATQRDLRLHVLVGDLRTLGAGLPAGLDVAVDAFGVSARAAIARGVGVTQGERFCAILREAGNRLRGFTEVTQPNTLTLAFSELIAQLDRLGSGQDTEPTPAISVNTAPTPAISVNTPPTAAVTIAEPPRADVPVLHGEPPLSIDDESDVVPIESLLLAEEEEAVEEDSVVPIESLEMDEADRTDDESALPVAPVASGWDLVDSYLHFEALLRGDSATAEPPSSLTALETTDIAAPGSEIAERPSRRAAEPQTEPQTEPRHTEPGIQLVEVEEGDIVEIDTLLYRGRTALHRADDLRREIRAIAIGSERAVDLKPMVDELLDLVELAMTD